MPPQALILAEAGKITTRAVQRITWYGQLLLLFVISKQREINPVCGASMRWVLISQQLFYTTEEKDSVLSGLQPLHSHMSAGQGLPYRPMSGESCSWGHLPLSDPSIHHSFKLSQAGWTRSVCSGSRSPESFRRRHVERKRGLVSGPGRKAGAGCCGRLGFAFVRKEVRPESGAVSTQALWSAAIKHRRGEALRTTLNSHLRRYVLLCVTRPPPKACRFLFKDFNAGVEWRHI